MNRIGKFRLAFTLVFIFTLFLLGPILSTTQFTQGISNSNNSGNYSSGLNNKNDYSSSNYDLHKAPDLNSFFDSYSDENYIKTESYLPNQIGDFSDLTTPDSEYNVNDFSANIDLSKVAYSFGETVHFTIQIYNKLVPANNVQLSVIILEGDSYYYWYYNYGNFQVITTITATTDGNGFYEGEFNPPTEGTYSIVVIPTSYSTYSIARRVVTVSDIALFWRTPYEAIANASTLSYAMVVSTEDFSPINNANVTLYKELWYHIGSYYTSHREKISSYLTDETGLLAFEYEMFKGDSDYFYLVLEADKDGSTTELRQYQYFNDYNYYNEDIYQKYSFITTSDKPIYQPGDNIFSRTIVFYEDYWKVSKEVARNTIVEFEFQTSEGYTLYHDTLITDDYGIIEWNYNLDEDAKLGNYYIIFSKEESSNTFTIEVDNYEKPDFRVTIDLEKEYVPPKDYIQGEIIAEYYFGKPVPGTVVVEFYYFGMLIDSMTGTLNSKGKFSFSWQVPKYKPDEKEALEALVVRATVTDIVDRTVTAEKDVTCQSTLYSYIWTRPYGIVKKGEDIKVIFNAFQSGARGDYYGYYWSPIADAKVILTVKGITQYLREKKLFEIESQTDEYGRGIESISLPDSYFDKYKTFVIELKVITDDGRVGEDFTAISVALVEAQISITPQDNINPGDSVKIGIKFFNIKTGDLVKGKASIYVMDSEYDTICYDWDISTDGYEEITIKLSDFAPDGNYRINTYFRYNDFGGYFFPKFASGTEEFSVGENYYISLQTTQDSYSTSDRFVLLGKRSHIGTTPTIIEVTKRGIVDVYSINGSQSTFELIIDDLTGLAPKFTIFAYAITETGLIIEEFLIITVEEELNVSIKTNKEIYEPGDTATISVQVTNENGEFVDAMSVFSLIDSSIFGVKEDSLSEEEFFENDRYWCEVQTSSSWTAPMYRWWYWWVYEDEYYDYTINYAIEDIREGGTFTDVSTLELSNIEFAGEIRDYLPESAFWMPELKITDGNIEFTVTLPDNIGEWTIRLFVTTETQGLITKHTFKTFLPFFVDLKVPQGTIQDNVVVVRGIAYNYLNSASVVQLTIDVDGLTLINNQTQSIVIPQDYLVEIRWSIYCNDFGKFNITLTGIALTDNSTSYDGIRKSMIIQPNGITYTQSFGGFINGSDTLYYELFDESVYNSVDLIISSGMMNLAINSWERLIGYPYGCMEQTMSKVFPDILIYQYLQDNDLLTPSLENSLLLMLQVGLSRISSFQHTDGGWGWWNDDVSQPFMTAVILYGLGLLSDINFNLDSTQIMKAINYLASHQNTNGAFSTDSWRIDDLSFTAYVIRALTSHNIVSTLQVAVINDAIDYFMTAWDAGSSLKNPYAAALFIDGTIDTSYENSVFIEALETYILSEAISIDNGFKWTSFDDDSWHSLGGDVETTASVIIALTKIDYLDNFVVIKKAMNWLLSVQNNYGWGSTADTSAAIRAIITIANYSSVPLNCTVEIFVDSWSTEIEYNESSSDYLIASLFELEDILSIGNNSIVINQTGSGQIYYYFTATQILRADPIITIEDPVSAAPGETFTISVTIESSSSLVLPANVQISSFEPTLETLNNANQTIQLVNGSEVIYFSYRAPETPGEYFVGGYGFSYTFVDSSLENFATGYISKNYAPVLLIVISSSEQSVTCKSMNYMNDRSDSFLLTTSTYDITLNRHYSQTTNILRGDTIEVEIVIDNQWESKEFVMFEDYLPAGFMFDPSSINTGEEIVDYYYSSNRITFFLSELSLGEITISYRIIANDVASSIVQSAKLSSMYEIWFVESDPTFLGSYLVTIDPITGLVITDTISPILKNHEMTLEAYYEEYYDVSLTITVEDDYGVSSVFILYTDEDNVWVTREAFLVESFNNGTSIYSIDLGEYVDQKLSYLIAIEDFSGNVFYSSIETTSIPVVAIAFTFIFIIITISAIIGISSSMATLMLRPKPKTEGIIDRNVAIAFKETPEDLACYEELEPYKDQPLEKI